MTPERRSLGYRRHIRGLKTEARHGDSWENAQRLLRAQIPDFDNTFGQHLSVLRDYFEFRKKIFQTGDYSTTPEFIRKYSHPEGSHYNPKHPEILKELRPATNVIRGLYNRRG